MTADSDAPMPPVFMHSSTCRRRECAVVGLPFQCCRSAGDTHRDTHTAASQWQQRTEQQAGQQLLLLLPKLQWQCALRHDTGDAR